MNSIRKFGRGLFPVLWFCFVAVLLALLPVRAVAGSETERVELPRPDLSGVVKDDGGRPVPGASVFIYTAGPKEGAGVLCPSCYADCRKRTTADEYGHFKIESLDPTLLFRILVVAKDKQPEFVAKVDPSAKPLEVLLQTRKGAPKPDQQMKGRVVDKEGKAVSGAVISIRGVKRGDSTRYGGNDEMDQVAVSDDEGLFSINSQTSFEAVGVEVEARGFAKGVFPPLATGGALHELKLTEGASVKGRLLKDGKPLAGVEVAVSGVEREAGIYVGDFSVGTDKEGKFLLVDLPPNRDYWLYGKMASLGERGAFPAVRKRVEEDGSILDVGDLSLFPGLKLAGQVKLTDGKPVPAKTRLLLSRDEAWDSVQTEADEQGRFAFAGVPSEAIELSTRIKGYRLSNRNKSLDVMNPFHLVGTLKADKSDLLLEFEPGDELRGGNSGNYVDLRAEPLLGAEPVKERKGDIHVTLRVVDAESQSPIAAFTVTEGRISRFPQAPQWFNTRQADGTNGQIEVYLNKSSAGDPALMAEAEGYLPESSGAITSTETNLTLVLHKGKGPNGVVLQPDGAPVREATVYLTDMQNGVYVQDTDMKVQNRIYQGTRSTRTDENGRFSFRPTVDDYAVLVLEDQGFAQVRVETLRKHPEVKLKPWAKVEGTLMIGSRPGTNEEMHLWPAHLPYEHYPRNFPPLNLYLKTETDSKGHFAFDRVPPICVQVYHGPKVKDEKMGTNPMTQTTSFPLGPGEVKTVTIGGQGRPVIGRVVVNGYEGKINWRSDVYTIEKILPPAEELPDFAASSRELSGKIMAADSDEEKKRLSEEMRKMQQEIPLKQQAFYATEKGREYWFQNKRYCLNFTTNGTFRIEDVPGGKYRLRIDLREGGSDFSRFSSPAIAGISKDFEVPDSPGGRTDQPFDLGTIEMQAKKAMKVGSIAPEFSVKTVDDKPLKLSDFSGKYVLLDFWAVWCGPCVAETPHLKETYNAFKDDPRFRMVGLSLDPISKTPRDYAKKNELGWIMGFLGDWSKADLPSKYGVEGIPSIFLIGPDGKIVAKDLRGDAIKAAVQRVLATTSAKAGK